MAKLLLQRKKGAHPRDTSKPARLHEQWSHGGSGLLGLFLLLLTNANFVHLLFGFFNAL